MEVCECVLPLNNILSVIFSKRFVTVGDDASTKPGVNICLLYRYLQFEYCQSVSYIQVLVSLTVSHSCIIEETLHRGWQI